MKRNALWAFALILAMGLIAAGCGDDDDDGDGGGEGGEALSKEEYVDQGNQICEDGNQEVAEAAESLGNNPDQETQEEFVTETVVPSIQGQIDDLREGIPEGDEDQVNGFLDQAEDVLDQIEDDPSALTSGAEPFAEVNQQLISYGLTACGS